jgi:hypothetical protein
MRSDPEPMDATVHLQAKCSVIEANANAVVLAVSDAIEVKRWVRWICFELGEVAIGERLNLGR